MDLHSKRSQVNFGLLAEFVRDSGGSDSLAHQVRNANTALEALTLCQESGIALGDLVAARAREAARTTLQGAPVEVEVLVINRGGDLVGRAGFG